MSRKARVATRIIISVAACMSLAVGCQQSSQHDEWMDFAKAVLVASKANNADSLLHDFSLTDLSELYKVKQEVANVAIPSDKEQEADREDSEKHLRAYIQTYLSSYPDLFDDEPVKVIAEPSDPFGSSAATTEQDKKLADTLAERMHPHRVVIWVRHGDKFRGILLPEVYKTNYGIKVGLWIGQVDPISYASGAEITKVIPVLERASLESCDLPSSISFRTEYSDGSHGLIGAHGQDKMPESGGSP